MSTKDYSKLADGVFQAVSGFIVRSVGPVCDKVVALEKELSLKEERIKALEQRIEVRYLGVYKDGQPYTPGSMCTHAGSLWYCRDTTRARPGSSSNCGWVLAVKNGSLRGNE